MIGKTDKYGHIVIIQKDINNRISAYLILVIDQN